MVTTSSSSSLPSKRELLERVKSLKTSSVFIDEVKSPRVAGHDPKRSYRLWSEKSRSLHKKLTRYISEVHDKAGAKALVPSEDVNVLHSELPLGVVEQITISSANEVDPTDFEFRYASIGHALRHLECRWVFRGDGGMTTSNTLLATADIPLFVNELLARLPQRKLSQKQRCIVATLKGTTCDGEYHLRPLCTEADLVLAVNELLDSKLFDVGCIHIIDSPIKDVRIERLSWYEASYNINEPLGFFKVFPNVPEEDADLRPFLCPLSTARAFHRVELAASAAEERTALTQTVEALLTVYKKRCHVDELIIKATFHLQSLVGPNKRLAYRLMQVAGMMVQTRVAVFRRNAIASLGGREMKWLHEREVALRERGEDKRKQEFNTMAEMQVALMDEHLLGKGASGNHAYTAHAVTKEPEPEPEPEREAWGMTRIEQIEGDISRIRDLHTKKVALRPHSAASTVSTDSDHNLSADRAIAAFDTTQQEHGTLVQDENDVANGIDNFMSINSGVTTGQSSNNFLPADEGVGVVARLAREVPTFVVEPEPEPDPVPEPHAAAATSKLPHVFTLPLEQNPVQDIELVMDTHMLYLSRGAEGSHTTKTKTKSLPSSQLPRQPRSTEKVVGLMQGYLKAFAKDISDANWRREGSLPEVATTGLETTGEGGASIWRDKDKQALDSFKSRDQRSQLSRRKDWMKQRARQERVRQTRRINGEMMEHMRREEDSKKVYAFAKKLSPLEVLHMMPGGAASLRSELFVGPNSNTTADSNLTAEKSEEKYLARRAKARTEGEARAQEGHEVLEILLSYCPDPVAHKVRTTVLKKYRKVKTMGGDLSSWDVLNSTFGKGGMSYKRLMKFLTQKGRFLTEDEMEKLFRRLSTTGVGGKRRTRALMRLSQIMKVAGKYRGIVEKLRLEEVTELESDDDEQVSVPVPDTPPPSHRPRRKTRVAHESKFTILGDTREIPILEELELDSDGEVESKTHSDGVDFNDSLTPEPSDDVPEYFIVKLPAEERPSPMRARPVRDARAHGIALAGKGLIGPLRGQRMERGEHAQRFKVNVTDKTTGEDWLLRIEQLGKIVDAEGKAQRRAGSILYGGLVDGNEALSTDLWVPTIYDGTLPPRPQPSDQLLTIAAPPLLKRFSNVRRVIKINNLGEEKNAEEDEGEGQRSGESKPGNRHLLNFLLDVYQ